MSTSNRKLTTLPSVVVVGAGVSGLSTAWELAKKGHPVTVLERSTVGAYDQASSINSGMVHYEPAPAEHPHQFEAAAGRIGMETYQELQDTYGHDIEWRRGGMILLARSEQQLAHAQAYLTPTSCPQLLSKEQALQKEPGLNPDSLFGAAWWDPEFAGVCHPRKAMHAIRTEAQKQGTVLHEHTEVMGVEANNGGWKIRIKQLSHKLDLGADEEIIEADVVVLANGALTPGLVPTGAGPVPVVPVIGTMYEVAPGPNTPSEHPFLNASVGSFEASMANNIDPADWGRLGPEDVSICVTHELDKKGQWGSGQNLNKWGKRRHPHLYMKQLADGKFVFGGDRLTHPLLHAGQQHPDRLPDCKMSAGDCSHGSTVSLKLATDAVATIGTMKETKAWAGIMPFSPDGASIIGLIPGASAPLYACTGNGGSGFMRGPGSGKLLADFIHTGEMPKELEECDPARFREWQGLDMSGTYLKF